MSKFLLIAILLPVSVVVYNASIRVAMQADLAKKKINSETGIMKGAEPIYLEGSNSKAVMLIHGYIGTPTDFGRLPKLLNEKGYTVYAPLLPGHGRDPKEFSKTTSDELIDYVSKEYELLAAKHDEVIPVGFSMGGALATILTTKYKIKKVVLLAPYYEVSQQWYYLLPVEVYSKAVTPIIPYLYRPKMFKQINNKSVMDQIIDYDFISTKGSEAILELGKRAKQLVPEIEAETIILHSTHDKATDYKVTKELAQSIKNLNKFVTLEKSNHMLLWDYDVAEVESEIIKFITSEGKS